MAFPKELWDSGKAGSGSRVKSKKQAIAIRIIGSAEEGRKSSEEEKS